MLSNEEMHRIAMRQSALDLNAREEDFLKAENVIVQAKSGSRAKKFYKEPITCMMVSYGENLVASVQEDYRELVEEYLRKFTFYHCFEPPNLLWLDDKLRDRGQRVCFTTEYFLPDPGRLRKRDCGYEIRVLHADDFGSLYVPQWGNALCEERRELDVLGVGAYEKGKLIGLAGCSADAEEMWQIGIDVLPEYRRKGIAASLTSHLAMEVLERNKVPFYGCAWSNIRSAGNAVRSGFVPAWAELSVKPAEIVDEMNC